MRFYHRNEQLSAQCAIGGTFLRRSLLILLQCQDSSEFLVLLELREEEFFHRLCLARLLCQFCCMEGNAFRTEVPESNIQVG